MSRMITVTTYTARNARPPAQWFTVSSSALPDGRDGLRERWSNQVTVTAPAPAVVDDRERRPVSEWHPCVADGVPLSLRADLPDPTVVEAWIDDEHGVPAQWIWFVDPEPVSTNTEFKADPESGLGVVEIVRTVWSEITR